MASKPHDVFTTSVGLLEELNREIAQRSAELPPELQALLAQKGAVTQILFKEMMRLLNDTARQAEAYDALIEKCKIWREHFFIPLRDQSDGKPMAESIYLSDLVEMIAELERVIQ